MGKLRVICGVWPEWACYYIERRFRKKSHTAPTIMVGAFLFAITAAWVAQTSCGTEQGYDRGYGAGAALVYIRGGEI